MRVTIKTLVIIVLAVAVLAALLLFAYSSFEKGTKNTNSFWDWTANVNKNTTARGGGSPPPIKECKKEGEGCNLNTDCCTPYICRKQTSSNDKECLPCGHSGDYCEENSNCCSGNCNTDNVCK